jgi:hypothetical protein
MDFLLEEFVGTDIRIKVNFFHEGVKGGMGVVENGAIDGDDFV